jgi:hypothetical protein
LSIDQGSVPIPFETWRTLAKRFGIEPQMPEVELNARATRMALDADNLALRRFADLSATHGAMPVVLVLGAVLEDPAPPQPSVADIRKSGLRVLDLTDVYPAAQRAELRVAAQDSHPNARAHRLIADRLYDELVPIIESLQP